jgi:hypothetical protein
MKHRSLTSGEVRIDILQIDFEGTGLDHYVSISFRVYLQHFNLRRTHFDGAGILLIEGVLHHVGHKRRS